MVAKTIDLIAAHDEFAYLKRQNQARNVEYFLLRQAVKGNFRWPANFPAHIEKRKHNLCKPIVDRYQSFLMGKGFSKNVERPNTMEFRAAAEKTEKIIARLDDLSNAILKFSMGARHGSMLGRTVYKTYKKGQKGAEHACFALCQPDYFYGIPSGDGEPGDFAVVYYSYPLDIGTAKRRYPGLTLKTEAELDKNSYYEPRREDQAGADEHLKRARRIPVLEIWTPDCYALEVGGNVIYNGVNDIKDNATNEGIVPFVVIENVRAADDSYGEADIAQARELNEALNYLLSRKDHFAARWLTPTLIWEGAPQNYAEVITSTIGGGGAIPTRLGSRLYFLAYDRPNPAIAEQEATLRQAILEVSGMSELALQGRTRGSVNTGASLEVEYQSVVSTVGLKHSEWEAGIKKLYAQLLAVQEGIGDSTALGVAATNEAKGTTELSGEVVALSGTDIAGLRDVSVSWPGILPKDDVQFARLEIEKHAAGLQSVHTTQEKLGEEYPLDEIARIRAENVDPALKGEKVAEQMRAQMPLLKQQAEQQAAGQQEQVPPPDDQDYGQPMDEATLQGKNDIGAMLREAHRRSKPTLDLNSDQPAFQVGAGTDY